MSIPFTYAVVDDDGEILRKYRWSAKEAKWHKEQGHSVIKLEIKKDTRSPFEIAFDLVGECLV